MRRVISAGAVIFRRGRDLPDRQAGGHLKFLLLYHGRNYWNFPKGKLEEGERATQAFLREVEEETGLKHQDMRVLSGFRATDRYTFFDRYAQPATSNAKPAAERGQVFKIVIYYLVEARTRHIAISEEHEGFAWFTYREALKVARYKNTQAILKQAYEFIEKNLPRTTTRAPHHRERR
ncbi:MAG: NUDIX domain-containing protein [Candidatus Sungbacteria bacterium]|uniref:Bis(5'-nucleosyl)-tetraphosphatase [asymmetrical] n=1 Tax=Candidatus Sungiibacteriota bacterium TaxID=2750080 RepID=A0A932YW21_9BACT|nr:NUDIX domain-containing protein [Candidatus Sungbacteria bacterium]